MIDERIVKIRRLERVYNDKEDVKENIIDILSNYVDYCKQRGNRKPRAGQIFNEQEYRKKLNERKSTRR